VFFNDHFAKLMFILRKNPILRKSRALGLPFGIIRPTKIQQADPMKQALPPFCVPLAPIARRTRTGQAAPTPNKHPAR
jgi:hypothetical protein